MFDSLPYRNDAALVLRRLVRSLPNRRGVIGVGTCDKGLPAMLMAVASFRDLAGAIIPGGVTLPPRAGEDAGAVQTLGARFAHGMVTLERGGRPRLPRLRDAGRRLPVPRHRRDLPGRRRGARADGAARGARAVGPADLARRRAPHRRRPFTAVARRPHARATCSRRQAIENAMLVHAAFGGSTNLLIHMPAIAHAAGLARPTVDDWRRVNRAVPRLVDALPNGPENHPTVRVFLAGGVPEVMLHLRAPRPARRRRAARSRAARWDDLLDEWEASERRARLRARLREQDGVDPDDVICPPERARAKGMTSTVCFPGGNLAPERQRHQEHRRSTRARSTPTASTA